MVIVQFKVRDYTTIMVGQAYHQRDHHGTIREHGVFVQRGDGSIWKYEEYRITSQKELYRDEFGESDWTPYLEQCHRATSERQQDRKKGIV